ncbi:Uncharacterized protein TCM_017884 [Theobroma cacao]|uniref:Uncharacterized protein n=1 Tax=Theobroma cacao TaxID=3641 RepID=A0A061EE78_THECC|nr:Uncharacterized protein TCM_017884 [Theobroma cacao]
MYWEKILKIPHVVLLTGKGLVERAVPYECSDRYRLLPPLKEERAVCSKGCPLRVELPLKEEKAACSEGHPLRVEPNCACA